MQTIVMKKAALWTKGPLCHACYWAHIQKDFGRRRGGLCCFTRFRAVPFKVADCTDFSNKNVPTSRAEMENIALIIPTKPARTTGGFAGARFAGEQENAEEELISTTE
jgi:hypothetical protein